jgi:hypothetical protein
MNPEGYPSNNDNTLGSTLVHDRASMTHVDSRRYPGEDRVTEGRSMGFC